MYSYQVEQAIKAATILHEEQVRKGAVPLPYVTHVFAVATILQDYTDSEDVIVSALLHDTIEDTEYSKEELIEDFGETVAKIVLTVSSPQDTDKKQYTWKARKTAYRKQLVKAPEEALLVCAADYIHNMRSIVEEYYADHGRFVTDFGKHLEDRLHHCQEISNTLNRNLQSPIVTEFNHVFTEYKSFIADVKKTQENARA